MKTVEEAAIENCGCRKMDCGHCTDYYHADECPYYKKKESFEEGASFVQRWIPVEEEVPRLNDNGISDDILLQIDGFPEIGVYDCHGKFICPYLNICVIPSHWRPINFVI